MRQARRFSFWKSLICYFVASLVFSQIITPAYGAAPLAVKYGVLFVAAVAVTLAFLLTLRWVWRT